MTDDKPPLSRLETRRGLRISTAEGAFSTVWTVLTTGAFQIGFARYLGAGDLVLGLLAGLPAAVQLLQIPAALYSDRLPARKGFVAANAIAGRLCWLLILAIPFVVPPPARVAAFVVLLALSSSLLTMVTPAWTAWMSDLVPADSRGRYFGHRNMTAGIVTMLVPLPAGAFLDGAIKAHRFSERIGFATLFGVACAAACAGFVLLLRQPEPPRAAPRPERVNPFKALSAPLTDAGFRAFIVFSGAVVVSQGLAGQFFVAWTVDKQALHLPYLTVQLLSAVGAATALATTQVWGYLADKFGARPLLAIATAATVVAPLVWLFTVPGAYWVNVALIVLLNVISGVAWGGVGLAQFNLLLSSAPQNARSTYVAVFSATTGILGGLAPVAGGALMELLRPVAFSLGGVSFNNYKILFLVTALIRVGCVFLVRRVREPDGRSTRYVLEQLTSARPVTSFLKLQRLGRPVGESEREQVIEELGELRSPLAVEELVNALDDVSQAVRDGAVRALGEIRDSRAVVALAAKLSDPVAGIGELAADALGAIGSADALPALSAAASGEDAGVRVAAIRAMGRIGDPAAVWAVAGSLELGYTAACEAACVATSALAPRLPTAESRSLVADYLLPLLRDDAPRGVRYAAARAIRALSPAGATPDAVRALLACLAAEPDPAVASQVASAAARFDGVDGVDDAAMHETCVATLLGTLYREDMRGLARKQTLAAVAELGIAGEAFYPYLGMNESARDDAASRLGGELHRILHRAGADEGAGAATAALEAYTDGRYANAIAGVARLAAPAAPHSEPARRAAAVLEALSRRRAVSPAETYPEDVLLALLLARSALSA